MRWAAQEDLVPRNLCRTPSRAGKRAHAQTDRRGNCRDLAGLRHLGTREAAKNYGRLVKFLLVCAQRRDEGASFATATF